MKLLEGCKILIGVTGSIAAYKAAELIRQIRKEGGAVRTVLTEAAARFLSPTTFEALSGSPVWVSLFEDPLAHIELTRWADRMAVVPATANLLAKVRLGLADDLLSTLILAGDLPILIAPAMNRQMWHAQATQENVAILRQRGLLILGPDFGEQACGEVGLGRMVEPSEILAWLPLSWSDELSGVRVVVTAGPTREPLDPVRFLSNRSSGKMGYALARAARARGAEVVLISGPTALPPPWGVEVVRVERAEEMLQAVLAQLEGCDIFIGAAAVADDRPETVSSQKRKRSPNGWRLELRSNPDIIQTVSNSPLRPKLVVGFAAETERLLDYAHDKLRRKGLDAVVANRVGAGRGFEREENEVWWLTEEEEKHFPNQPKGLLADRLLGEIVQLYRKRCAGSS